MSVFSARLFVGALICLAYTTPAAWAQIPHGQSAPPGPALSPAEAIKKMTVPEGFSVEVVASEPDIMNPVAMTIDERGRFWITESFEYPRREPGPGRDRVKILEDTDGDGKADKFTVFAEGLNIPSGIAVGHGGVWVANSPDLLFLQDTDGDGKADKQEVVVTGFGRDDTHELPNSLTWGPDGWLYGLNGVFNASHVRYGKENPNFAKSGGENHPGWKFTCALFRIHPKTREFQVWCEGTSNPWGVAFDNDGSAFISACVIDHLWHLTESGYYHRQGGPYPPFTWKIESIVKHRHQKAAYCGIHYYNSDTYPEQYRNKLYMGNIHGGCLNSDRLERDGSTYAGKLEPDFLTANDAWFMPVAQKTGPDGCLYVLDWYDRYHCYQDANRDPAGIDRLKGRLYRVRYKNTPHAQPFDLSQATDEELGKLLDSGNGYKREIARRLLVERMLAEPDKSRAALTFFCAGASLEKSATLRRELLWIAVSCGLLNDEQNEVLLKSADPVVRAWGVRAAGDRGDLGEKLLEQIAKLASDESPDVQLQVAIAAKKLKGANAVGILTDVLAKCGDDRLIPRIVWQNLHPLLERNTAVFVATVSKLDSAQSPALREIMPRAIDRILAAPKPDLLAIATLFAHLSSGDDADVKTAGKCLEVLAARVQSRELAGEQLVALKETLTTPLAKILQGDANHPLYLDAALLATSWQDPSAAAAMRTVASSTAQSPLRRTQAVEALIATADSEALKVAGQIASDGKAEPQLRASAIAALARLDKPEVAELLLTQYSKFDSELQPRAIEVLTSRPHWSKLLLAAIEAKRIAPEALNVNQVRKLLAAGDADISRQVAKTWGAIRTERDPARESTIAEMRMVIRSHKGDPHKGQELFKKLCGQCHKMHGEGQEVGPDITVNGRGSFEQLLSNVFDPSLVIGASYQARTVVTEDGRVLTGLLVEDNEQRVVLKQQGGKLETIARGEVDEVRVSPLSLMPEGIEKQYQKQEIADLFAFLTLDKVPSDPNARTIPGTKLLERREEHDPKKYGQILNEILPGFTTPRSGEGGLAQLPEHAGRTNVLRTHPLERDQPCVLSRQVEVPAGKKTRLHVSVAHHTDPPGDWKLIVKVDGKVIHETLVGVQATKESWLDLNLDLSAYAGKTIHLQLINQPTDWYYEFGYWGQAEVRSE